MRLTEFAGDLRAVLTEGGNIFPDAVPFAQKNTKRIFDTVTKLMPKGVQLHTVGSAGHKPMSGDMDLQVDEQQVMQYFSVSDAKSARQALKDYFIKKGIDSALSGTNVHIKVPSPEGFAQVDLMFVPNAKNIAQFHRHDYANTKYKGAHKHIVLSSLAKYTQTTEHPQGFIWSAFQGLKDRATKEIVTDDPNAVAQMLVAPDATADDLRSVESILAKLPPDQQGKLQDAVDALAKEGLKLLERAVMESAGSLPKRVQNATRGLHLFYDSQLANSDYTLYRVMMACAGTDGKTPVDMPAQSWIGKQKTAHPYSEVESEMLKQVYKAMGAAYVDMNHGDMDSHELDGVNKVSPVPKRRVNSRGV